MSAVIRAGEDCWIEARDITDMRTGEPINVTGYSVEATARSIFFRAPGNSWLNPVLTYWSTAQGTILAGTETSAADPHRIEIHITPTESSGWHCPAVLIQAEMTDPVTGYVSRIIDQEYRVSGEAVR